MFVHLGEILKVLCRTITVPRSVWVLMRTLYYSLKLFFSKSVLLPNCISYLFLLCDKLWLFCQTRILFSFMVIHQKSINSLCLINVQRLRCKYVLSKGPWRRLGNNVWCDFACVPFHGHNVPLQFFSLAYKWFRKQCSALKCTPQKSAHILGNFILSAN